MVVEPPDEYVAILLSFFLNCVPHTIISITSPKSFHPPHFSFHSRNLLVFLHTLRSLDQQLASFFYFRIFNLLFFYYVAAISLPSYGNVTYVTKGSDVSLPWTYDFGGAAILSRQWFFSNRSSDLALLIYFAGATQTISSKSPFKDIDVNKPATLVLKNVNLDHNGTYRFTVTVDGITTPPFSEILVIIQGEKLIGFVVFIMFLICNIKSTMYGIFVLVWKLGFSLY